MGRAVGKGCRRLASRSCKRSRKRCLSRIKKAAPIRVTASQKGQSKGLLVVEGVENDRMTGSPRGGWLIIGDAMAERATRTEAMSTGRCETWHQMKGKTSATQWSSWTSRGGGGRGLGQVAVLKGRGVAEKSEGETARGRDEESVRLESGGSPKAAKKRSGEIGKQIRGILGVEVGLGRQ